jgi:transposase
VDKARYLVEPHLREGRPVAELAAQHGIHRSWLHKLLDRYKQGGLEALEPRSRRPRSCPHKTSLELEERIVALREKLVLQGHDAGPHTIVRHLERDFDCVPSPATVWRILGRNGLVTDQPQKRPKSSLIRFCAELPNEMWQADMTHWRLAGGRDVEILNLIDDHSRLFLASDAYAVVSAQAATTSRWEPVRRLRCPATSVSDVPRHHRAGQGGLEPPTSGFGDQRSTN